jgi:polysaccharide export outer membrane protein
MIAVGIMLTASGCSTLPSQGPSAADVIKEGDYRNNQTIPPYLVADLDLHTVSIIEKMRGPSFVGRFGDKSARPSSVIGVGDTVLVTVWEAASGGLFSSTAIGGITTGSHSAVIPEQIVGRDGAVTVPYAGRVHVAGLTTEQVERAVVSRLVGKAIEPQALVTVPHSVSNNVTVTGEVTNGARVPLSNRGDRLLDIIAAAGGIRAPVHETFIALSRGNATATVPMQALLKSPSENIFARPDDVITVVREPQTFTAFGAAGRNAMVPFEAIGLTLEEAVAKAGGLLDYQSDPQGVFLLRAEPTSVAHELDPGFPIEPGARTVNVVYRVNLKDANTYFMARRVAVHNKDVIYVASSMSNDFYKAMQLFSTLVSPAISGYAVSKI